jgi:hypothetical protein
MSVEKQSDGFIGSGLVLLLELVDRRQGTYRRIGMGEIYVDSTFDKGILLSTSKKLPSSSKRPRIFRVPIWANTEIVVARCGSQNDTQRIMYSIRRQQDRRWACFNTHLVDASHFSF